MAGVERREKEEVVLKECTSFDDNMLDRKRAIAAFMMFCVCDVYRLYYCLDQCWQPNNYEQSIEGA